MKTKVALIVALSLVLIAGCSKDSEQENPQEEIKLEAGEFYFPPVDTDIWETVTLQELNWNTEAEQPLHSFLEEKNTKAFLI